MNVLYYLSNFPKLSESFVLNELHELESRGYSLVVSASSPSKEKFTHEEWEELDIPIDFRGDIHTRDLVELVSPKLFKKRVFKYIPPLLNPQFQLSLLINAHRAIRSIERREIEIDLVHVHFASMSRYSARYIAAYFDVPVSVTAHAHEIFHEPNLSRIKFICDQMDHVIVPSEYNRQYLAQTVGIDSEMTVIPATTKITKFEPTHQEISNRILTVGRLVEKKGHKYGLEAIAALKDQGYSIEYHIVGEGPLKNNLKALTKRLGIDDAVSFLGHISDEQLRKELSQASIFLLPCIIASDGDRDAMPVVLKEAMAAETACISTTVSAIPELIDDGINGILVPPEQSDALAVSLSQLLDNTEHRRELAEKGRKTVESTYDIANSVDKLEQVFERLTT